MTTNNPDQLADVTVIVPAYRAAGTLERALLSIASQTVKPQAVVVVDDGSTDATYDVAEACRSRMNGIDFTVIRQSNAGPGAARNRALDEADTTYVAFLDADDEWMPEKIARSMAHIGDGDLVLVGHDSIEIDDGREKRLDCARRFEAARGAPYVGLYCRGFVDTTTVVARLDKIRAVGGFDVSLPNAQDFELWLAILAEPQARFFIFDDVLSRYHRQPGSVMTHVERRRQCCLKIAMLYAPVLRRHPGSPLISLWFRIAAIHREAVVLHVAQKQWGWALRAAFLLPGTCLAATWTYLCGPAPALRVPAPR